MEISAERLERGPIDGLLVSPPPLAAGKFGFGLVKVRQRLLPLSLEVAGDEPILRVDGAIAALGLSCCVAMALDVAAPLADRSHPRRRGLRGKPALNRTSDFGMS
jgi:hypothetical protein